MGLFAEARFIWELIKPARRESRPAFACLEGWMGDRNKDDRVDERPLVVSRGQVRKRRCDGWTRRDERMFLKHLRATSNVSASARAIGKSPSTAFDLRDREPAFALKWNEALSEADVRLAGKCIVYAETRGKPVPSGDDGEPADAGMENFDPDFALKLLRYNRERAAGGRRHDGTHRRRASIEDLTASILRYLAVLRKRRASQGRG
jgi:hypothetical protein